nr:hypothetical protein [Xanthomonas phaseoli]
MEVQRNARTRTQRMRYQKLLKLLAGLAGVMLAATGALLVALVAAGQVREGRTGALSIAEEIHNVSLGLHQLDTSKIDPVVQKWIATLDRNMDTTCGRTGAVKARMFTTDDQIEISHPVDELAHWFDSEDGLKNLVKPTPLRSAA